jgi:radical SAM protein with 4Fe4S-binding SPASM domain
MKLIKIAAPINYLNKHLLRYWNFVSGSTVISKLPTSYKIEPISVCNLRCPICVDIKKNLSKVKMSLDTFKKILAQIPVGSKIDLFGLGESLLHPNIKEMLLLAKKKKHEVCISSNLNIKTNIIEKIPNTGLDKIIVSLDGTTQETYEKYRIRGKIDLVFENMKAINRIKKNLNQESPFMVWQFIVNRYNEHQIEDAKIMARELEVELELIPMGLTHDMLDGPYSENQIEKLKKEWLPKNPDFITPYYLNKTDFKTDNWQRCLWLWEHMIIYADGSVMPCLKLTNPKQSFGNVNEDSLLNIWNNTLFRSARDLFITNNIKNCRAKCKDCDNYPFIDIGGIIKRNYLFLRESKHRMLKKLTEWLPVT